MRFQKILIILAMMALSNYTYSACGMGPKLCDADGDRDVDQTDINELILAKGTVVGVGDIKDPDGDLVITTLDARDCADLCTGATCTVPNLLGPVPEQFGNTIRLANGTYFAALGYQRREFILADIARSYGAPNYPSSGEVDATADPEDVDGDYNTRVVVLTPVDHAKFNGTAVVEWLNVTGGGDGPIEWGVAHNEFIREGYAWIGVSAQWKGVSFLKDYANPAGRYDPLLHPGDSYSYDIFSLAGQLAGEPASTLIDGLTADVVLATGQSQSASRLVTYINAIQPLEPVYDGFLVHSRGSSGSALRQECDQGCSQGGEEELPLSSISASSPTLIREDAALTVPVMVVEAQGDMVNNNFSIRQIDTPKFRLWEMAGTSHTDAYTGIGGWDPGDGSGTATMFGALSVPRNPFGCTNVNAGAAHWIVQAAFRGLDTWVRTTVAPTPGPPLQTTGSNLDRDADGNGLGGVRSPQVDAPLAKLDHVAIGGSGFCFLFGDTQPFTTTRIHELYSSKLDFEQKWSDAVDASVAAGFLLEVDGVDLKAAATGWVYPTP